MTILLAAAIFLSGTTTSTSGALAVSFDPLTPSQVAVQEQTGFLLDVTGQNGQYTVLYKWGDGSEDTVGPVVKIGIHYHKWNTPGTYSIIATATDSQAGTGSATWTIKVTEGAISGILDSSLLFIIVVVVAMTALGILVIRVVSKQKKSSSRVASPTVEPVRLDEMKGTTVGPVDSEYSTRAESGVDRIGSKLAGPTGGGRYPVPPTTVIVYGDYAQTQVKDSVVSRSTIGGPRTCSTCRAEMAPDWILCPKCGQN